MCDETARTLFRQGKYSGNFYSNVGQEAGEVGAELVAILNQEAFDDLDAPVMRVTAPDVPPVPLSAPVEKFLIVDKQKVLAGMGKLAAYWYAPNSLAPKRLGEHPAAIDQNDLPGNEFRLDQE